MKRFTVTWRPSAERALAEVWPEYPDRQALTDEINAVDLQLSIDPFVVGESRDGNLRIWPLDLIVVAYDVLVDDRRVDVLAVRVL